MSRSPNGVRLDESQAARFPGADVPPTLPGGPTERTREARILLRAAVELLGKRDLHRVAERAVHVATESFAAAARFDLLDDDGRLHLAAISDPSPEMILLSPNFDGSHRAIQELIAHGSTGLEAPEELRRALWGEAAVKKEVVLSALSVDRRTQGVLTFMSPPTMRDTRLASHLHLVRYAFVSIVSRAVGRAAKCEKRNTAEECTEECTLELYRS